MTYDPKRKAQLEFVAGVGASPAARDMADEILRLLEENEALRGEVQVLKARLYIRERYARENTTLAQYAEVERESYREGERVAHALMRGEPLVPNPGAAGLFPREEGR